MKKFQLIILQSWSTRRLSLRWNIMKRSKNPLTIIAAPKASINYRSMKSLQKSQTKSRRRKKSSLSRWRRNRKGIGFRELA